MSSDLRRKFLWSLVLALVIYVGLAVYGDWQKLTGELAHFPWLWLPAILGLTLVNYAGRLFKWHWYLGLVGVKIGWVESARIFGVGMIMVMTPGKVGEFMKAYMVKNVTGTPMSSTAPIVLAERITDGLAMLLLASVGMFAFLEPARRLLALGVLAALLAVVIVIQIRPLALWFLGMGRQVPFVKRFAGSLYQFYESSYTLFKPRNLVIAISIGTFSWLCEGLAYYLVVLGMGIEPSGGTMLIAVFIFSISTVLGAVVGTPGGLGGTEGGLVALAVQLLDMGRTPATAAALLIRFATLWFGVALGLISLGLWPYLLDGATAERVKG